MPAFGPGASARRALLVPGLVSPLAYFRGALHNPTTVRSPHHSPLSDLRGAARLAVEATEEVTGIVGAMHGTIRRLPLPLGRSHGQPAPPGLAGFVYRTIQRGTRLVGRGLDLGFAAFGPLLPAGEPSPRHDDLRSVVNGVCGDHLVRTGNPLAIEMGLHTAGREVDPSDPGRAFFEARGSEPGPEILLLVHGLCLNERSWARDGHDHGAALAEEFGCSPLYLRYNTGLPIADNGRELAEKLEILVHRWPVVPTRLVILGHSMGGLVARSACHQGLAAGHGWPETLHKLIFLGTPHLGAPLERGGHQLQRALGRSPYSAPLARLATVRSAGITDLRHGTVTADRSSVPLPVGVDCCSAAAVLAQAGEGPIDGWVGDGLVPLASALGRGPDPARALEFAPGRRWVGHGMGHQELLGRPEVYRQLRAWMETDPGSQEDRPPWPETGPRRGQCPEPRP